MLRTRSITRRVFDFSIENEEVPFSRFHPEVCRHCVVDDFAERLCRDSLSYRPSASWDEQSH